MCQCLIADCCWWNFCGACAGLHDAMCICSCWLCKPDEIKKEDEACCHCFDCDGFGGNTFCCGTVCCAPRYVKNYHDHIKNIKR